MKNLSKLTLLLFGLFLSHIVLGQDEHVISEDCNKKNAITVGFHLQTLGDEFGFGFHVISPQVFNIPTSLKLSGSLNVLEYSPISDSNITVREGFQSYQLGLLSSIDVIKNLIYVYGESGVVTVISDESFSTTKSVFGGYGVFGVEFYFSEEDNKSIFFEVGANGLDSKVEKDVTQKYYGNGLTISSGIRFAL